MATKPSKKSAPKTAKKTAKRGYKELPEPKNPAPDGLFAIKNKAVKNKTFGVKCLIDGVTLKYKSGRPPILCHKPACFKAYRNAYRRDYDPVRGAA